jgi:hypothetical protein
VLPFCIFLLVSYAVLPAKRTHRHYLSICFTLGICCMQVGFVVRNVRSTADFPSSHSSFLSGRNQTNAITRSHPGICTPVYHAPSPAPCFSSVGG